ncbi:GNAT family N-acetyltransferase [Nocardioides speluncae]|uniref:GNAT family N-acetyltransferase n=1 Tax=Nocardioides speluncae TaxID=2670337 RepID=UPI001F0B954A|nr:GNAT family N-acetyltransferase [Nocardioides speluncae]
MTVAIRPMHDQDVAAVEQLTDEGFYELDLRTVQRDWPDPERRTAAHSKVWMARTRHFLATDPGGCWVAEQDGELVGAAASFNRELMWILATYAVRPGLQGQGIGAQLLAAALQHGQGCLRGMLSASSDPKAVRRYRLAGFSLHPQMFLRGVVDRSTLPVVDRVRDGNAADVDLMNSVDRQTRGAAHGPDHEFLLENAARLVVADRTTGSGYAYVAENGSPLLLAATNRRTAADLLWESLASSPPDGKVTVPHLTAVNEWAVDVGLAARLELHQSGYLALRNMKPPAPYIHHGALL